MNLLGFAIALLLTMVLIPPLTRLAEHLQVLDLPSGRKVHTAPMPRIGGIAMGIASLVPIVLWLPLDSLLRGYVAGALCLLVAGAIDDRYTLSPATKALGQLVAIVCFMLISGVHFDTVIVVDRLSIPAWLGYSLTVPFLLGVTNAVNLSDGLDGLAGGLTLLSCAALALLGQSWNQPFVQTVGVVIAGSILGFLRFNTFPARIFMGDAGSQFLGFSVGVLAVYLVQQHVTALSSAVPLFLIGLPLIDTLAVTVLRLRAGVSPFAADRRHLHHRLLGLGFDHYEVVAAIYALQCLLLLLAWQLRFASDLLIIAVYFLLVQLGVQGPAALQRHGWRWRQAAALPVPSAASRLVRWLAHPQRLPSWSIRFACLCTVAYWLGVARYATAVPEDVRWLSAAAMLLLVGCLHWRNSDLVQRWLVRGTLYVAVVTAVFLDHNASQKVALLQAVKFVFLPLLAVSVAIAVRFSRERKFGATPVDLLLVFGALALPNLPGLHTSSSDLGLSIAKLFALCYAVELIATLGSRLRFVLHGAGALFFLVIALRGWL